MEQHKVLLIIVSVTIVLAAVVGVGLWLFYPRDGADAELAQGATAESGGYEWQPLDYLQGQGEVPGLEGTEPGLVEEPDEFEVTYGVLPETGAAAGRPTMIETSVPETAGAAPSAGAETGAATPTMVEVPSAATAAAATSRGSNGDLPSASTTATTSSGSTASVTTSSARPSTASTRADGALADRAYWVQAISSPSRDTAEQAQVTLREHQLGSRILTKVIDGRTYYRLRIGPFAVRAEAEKFMGWVQAISGFADAMIFVDYSTPVLAARAE